MKSQEKIVKNNRRQLLKMMASGAASAPLINAGLLTAGAGLSSAASAVTPVKNVIFVFIPGGAPPGTFTPTSTLQLGPSSAPLEPVKQECVFFSQTDMGGYAGHGLPQTSLGAFTAPKTIDLALGDLLGGNTLFSSIRLGVLSQGQTISAVNQWNRSYDVITDPRQAFEIMLTLQRSSVSTEEQYKQLEINLKAVQQLQLQLGSFANTRLQANESALQQLQGDLYSTGYTPGCDLQQVVWPDIAINPNDGKKFTQLWEMQANNAITAIKCGLTHVVTMLMGNDEENFLVTDFDYPLSQAANAYPTMREYSAFRAYFSARLAYLIQQLKTTTDINGVPLLDSTLVVQVTNMGNTSDNTGSNAPFMFAGGGSSIRRGQVVPGYTHSRVLDTVVQAMGVYGKIPTYSTAGPITGVVV